ncbi:MAG: hypothetical protein EZS28_016067 [Streblomastix strix]|uniref:Uncharacterized protein n=1 Tax=Streblomastix strix TaxID=222440 RepID=A0A5J4W1J4_9EUKA|nr:MAG: hypothetical protein EZS28_016067 [Streblomastix strix]
MISKMKVKDKQNDQNQQQNQIEINEEIKVDVNADLNKPKQLTLALWFIQRLNRLISPSKSILRCLSILQVFEIFIDYLERESERLFLFEWELSDDIKRKEMKEEKKKNIKDQKKKQREKEMGKITLDIKDEDQSEIDNQQDQTSANVSFEQSNLIKTKQSILIEQFKTRNYIKPIIGGIVQCDNWIQNRNKQKWDKGMLEFSKRRHGNEKYKKRTEMNTKQNRNTNQFDSMFEMDQINELSDVVERLIKRLNRNIGIEFGKWVRKLKMDGNGVEIKNQKKKKLKKQ